MVDIMESIQTAILVLVPMLLSLTVHEYAHARSAYALGDPTAKLMGRMSLSPLSHIDIFGTIILPIIAIASGGPFFGWAKPVPINPLNFRRRIPLRLGMLITAAMGPTSNLILAFLLALLLKLMLMLVQEPGTVEKALFMFLLFAFKINIVLAVFNLIPIPPLDGSRVLFGLLPEKAAWTYAYLERNPFFVLIAFAILITQAPKVLSFPVAFVERVIASIFGLQQIVS
jgi:Zn-dependent protease